MKTGTTTATITPLVVNVAELMAMLNVSQSSIERGIRERRIPAPSWLGGIRFWRRSEIEQWVEAGCPSAAEWATRRQEAASA
jgi:predicted DNA-binding transcriptional regulator AlpA